MGTGAKNPESKADCMLLEPCAVSQRTDTKAPDLSASMPGMLDSAPRSDIRPFVQQSCPFCAQQPRGNGNG